jgi:hypothetical protein
VAGSEESLDSSVAFLFTVGVCCEAVVPRFRVGTAGRFFLLLITINALKNSGEQFQVDNLLMKACSCSCSCVSMTPLSQ